MKWLNNLIVTALICLIVNIILHLKIAKELATNKLPFFGSDAVIP
jgi:hypothetical protein